jgi:hypothetical protein
MEHTNAIPLLELFSAWDSPRSTRIAPPEDDSEALAAWVLPLCKHLVAIGNSCGTSDDIDDTPH